MLLDTHQRQATQQKSLATGEAHMPPSKSTDLWEGPQLMGALLTVSYSHPFPLGLVISLGLHFPGSARTFHSSSVC